MIAFVKGILEYIEENRVVIDHQGIGFEVFVPASVAVNLPQPGNEVKLHTYTYVREDALNLYGFLTRDELGMFKILITVSGIGPKGALGILSAMDVDTLRFAVMSDDAAQIAKAPGIGKKTASKLILELKDKIHLEDVIFKDTTEAIDSNPQSDIGNAANEAIQALVALGYSSTEAAKAVKRVELKEDMTVEDILKASLKNIG